MQAHGDGLGPGWQLVLDMLEDVATKEESNARIIRVGHECVDLIITDFLPSLCLLYTSPSPRDRTRSRMPSSA